MATQTNTQQQQQAQQQQRDQKGSATPADTSANKSATKASDAAQPIRTSSEVPARRRSMFNGGRLPTPFELMRRMNSELERLVEAVEMQRGATAPAARANTPIPTRDALVGDDLLRADWIPRTDVVERDGAMVVRAELPGVKPDDIVVNVENGVLSIWGERQQERREERDRFVRTERVQGTFARSIPLPEGADEEHIAAAFQDGVLELTIPVAERARGRRVTVQSSQPQGTS